MRHARGVAILAFALAGLAGCGSDPVSKVEEPTLPNAACTTETVSPGAVPSAAGCTCKPTWTYAGKTFCNGACANPDGDANGPWCFTSATCNGMSWSFCRVPEPG